MRGFLCTVMMFLMMMLVSGCGENSAQDSERGEGEYQKIKLVMSVNGTNIAAAATSRLTSSRTISLRAATPPKASK